MNALTARFVDGTRRSRTGSATPQRWPVVAPLLIAIGLLILPALAVPTRADHARPIAADDQAAVVAAYVAAVNAGDLEGILALYADDAVHVALPTADGSAGVCVGKEQFRRSYEQAVANGERLEVAGGTLAGAGDRATFVARLASGPWRELGIEALEANVEAVVEGGRIATHVVMLTPASVRELLAVQGTGPTQLPASEPEADQHRHGPR